MTAFEDTPATPAKIVTVASPDAEAERLEATELPEVPRVLNNLNVTAESETTDDPFKLGSKYAYTPRKLKVFTIGAGFSGLLMAHKFQHRFPEMQDIVEHTIFEALPDVGGTWLVNNYPGVQCDVPAHIYVSPPYV
jgi:hypothetical protein